MGKAESRDKNVSNIYTLISFIRISKNRLKIMKELNKTPSFPSEISRRLKVTFSTVSKVLKELERKNLIICVTPEVHK